MKDSKKKIILIGAGETAELAYEYFTHDSAHEVVAFSVNEQYIEKSKLYGIDVVPLEALEETHPPDSYQAFVAVSYTQLNRIRARLFAEVKEKGYTCVSYISSKAFVWHTAEIGENCMIFENNVIQHGVTIEDDVILWSGNHIGHQTTVKKHAYISSHVVISGFCEIGESSFLGVNACTGDHITVAEDNIISAGAVILRNTEPGKVYIGNPAKAIPQSSYKVFRVKEQS